jgi:type I restriction enzyme M protein
VLNQKYDGRLLKLMATVTTSATSAADPSLIGSRGTDTSASVEKLEADLWEAADNLRANSKLTSSDYFMPVLGVIFLRHAANRFDAATQQIEADQASGVMPRRPVVPADYHRRRALWLPEAARYEWIMERAATSGSDLPRLVTQAMTEIEDSFEPLQGVLPKDYGIFEPTVLEDLMRLFNSERVKHASGDVFGRIYEYFLAKFSIQKAHDNGEFFTPPSLVQMIVNVIEPNHGIIFDPACGSGGMFVQSSHFIEDDGGDTAKKVVFYGQEKNRDTIRLAQMNLAVHGLEGKIAEAITYYQDEHNLVGRCDFVMANPPFNVDLVDAERIKTDPRLPFSLPGVNKEKRVSNANYLWISYFWSYLSERGRAGFVMSSQASSAGHREKDVRRQLVQTSDVDVMVAIRPNFFYTRTVPCELWHLDRNKPEERRDTVLMLDARSVYRKVSRKVYDLSPEQLRNLSAIVWLYRGQRDRFLALVTDYFATLCSASASVEHALSSYEAGLVGLTDRFETLKLAAVEADAQLMATRTFVEEVDDFRESVALYRRDAEGLVSAFRDLVTKHGESLPTQNEAQHAARVEFDASAGDARDLVKQVDSLYKRVGRVSQHAAELASAVSLGDFDRRGLGRDAKQLDASRKQAVEQLKEVVYFHRQILWLHDRFPEAELCAVPGLVRAVSLADIEEADWSLTPGRYVGVAPSEDDEDFDFEQALLDIHTELRDLNGQAQDLGMRIQENFEELGL